MNFPPSAPENNGGRGSTVEQSNALAASGLTSDGATGTAPSSPAPAARADGRQAAERTDAAVELPRWQPPRAAVRTVACPRCGAAAGSPCLGRRGPRAAHHAERVVRFEHR